MLNNIMAHKVIDNKAVVDWSTGDPEGDRKTVLAAYRDFIKEIKTIASTDRGIVADQIIDCFEKWGVETEKQIDDIPRIWIKRPA